MYTKMEIHGANYLYIYNICHIYIYTYMLCILFPETHLAPEHLMVEKMKAFPFGLGQVGPKFRGVFDSFGECIFALLGCPWCLVK